MIVVKPKAQNVLALVKPSGQKYVFIYDDAPESRCQLMYTLGRYAADPELSFTWGDACGIAAHTLSPAAGFATAQTFGGASSEWGT